MGPAKFVNFFHMIKISSWSREQNAINAPILQIVGRGGGSMTLET